MKEFYDRVPEMTELREMQRQSYNDYSRFVVLPGRRRVGVKGRKKNISPRGETFLYCCPKNMPVKRIIPFGWHACQKTLC